MHAAVVKLNSLSDSVGAAAEDHNLWFFSADGVFILRVVCGIVVGAVFGAAYVHAFPGLFYADLNPAVPDISFRDLQDLAQILIREAVLLGCGQLFIGGKFSFFPM